MSGACTSSETPCKRHPLNTGSGQTSCSTGRTCFVGVVSWTERENSPRALCNRCLEFGEGVYDHALDIDQANVYGNQWAVGGLSQRCAWGAGLMAGILAAWWILCQYQGLYDFESVQEGSADGMMSMSDT